LPVVVDEARPWCGRRFITAIHAHAKNKKKQKYPTSRCQAYRTVALYPRRLEYGVLVNKQAPALAQHYSLILLQELPPLQRPDAVRRAPHDAVYDPRLAVDTGETEENRWQRDRIINRNAFGAWR
jgi:hypothetical protein